jgi:membrane-associated phospholipid phosphatase
VTAWGVVAAGVAAPLARKRIGVPKLATQTVAFAAPFGLCLAVPRSRGRDVAVCSLQMWAYLAAYKTPHDDEESQAGRVHIRYPMVVDRAIGLGELPSLRLQRALAKFDLSSGEPRWRRLDKTLVWAHWMWFAVPHGALAYVLVRRPERFAGAAVMTYAVFDLGAMVYWVLPTAPPWYAAAVARQMSYRERDLRRMMVEYGEHFWRDGWGPLYSVFGGNPLAAMPSLHFATSLMAALLLAETGPVAGAVGFGYTAVLGFSLVYLGEHYVMDLIAGLALTGAVRRLAPRAGPPLAGLRRVVAGLEACAHEGVAEGAS